MYITIDENEDNNNIVRSHLYIVNIVESTGACSNVTIRIVLYIGTPLLTILLEVHSTNKRNRLFGSNQIITVYI
jgi:hypothetical protein